MLTEKGQENLWEVGRGGGVDVSTAEREIWYQKIFLSGTARKAFSKYPKRRGVCRGHLLTKKWLGGGGLEAMKVGTNQKNHEYHKMKTPL